MNKSKALTMASAVAALFISAHAHAGMVTDSHGNVGYDTAAECDAAVQAGQAKFYQSFTHKPPLLRAGEKSVRAATIRDLGEQYRLGACDIGVGRKLGRDGVASALQGKYVPYSPDMPVNVYSDATGKPVRVSMKQCDNWFSDRAPRPVSISQPKPAPVAAVVPAVIAPVVAQAKTWRPYAFGTVGALRDGLKVENNGVETVDSNNTRFAGQVGAGVQANEWLGGEVFYQGAKMHKFTAKDGETDKIRNHTAGVRATVGTNVTDKARVFGKVGVAAVRHADSDVIGGDGKTRARLDAGVGATYNITDNWAVRADYDHYFKRSNNNTTWKDSDYLGLGAQYNF